MKIERAKYVLSGIPHFDGDKFIDEIYSDFTLEIKELKLEIERLKQKDIEASWERNPERMGK